MRTTASTDMDQAEFLLMAMRQHGLSISMATDSDGRSWLVVSGWLADAAASELRDQARLFKEELLAILAREAKSRSAAREMKWNRKRGQ